MKERVKWRSILAKLSMSVTLSLSSASAPVSPSFLPDNPCSPLQPFTTIALQLQTLEAPRCVSFLRSGREVIVDFAHLGRRNERIVAALTRRDIMASADDEVGTNVSIIPASSAAESTYQSTVQQYGRGCVHIPSAELSAAAVALDTMPALRRAAAVVAIVPQLPCIQKGELPDDGLSYINPSVATVYEGETGPDPGMISSTVTHEGIGGHISGLGHTGFIIGYQGDLSYDTFTKSGSVVTIPRDYFTKGATYFEYDHRTIMGMGDFGANNSVPQDTPIQLADIDWARSLVDTNSQLHAQFLPEEGSVAMTEQQIQRGDFVFATLPEPIQIFTSQKQGDNDTTLEATFGHIAFIPQINPHTGKVDAISLWLYDSSNRNNAYIGTDTLTNLPLGFQKISIADNTFTLHLTQKGITIAR